MSDGGGGRPYASWFIGGFGAVLILAAVAGYYAGLPTETTIGFTVIGAALVVVGALQRRLAGTLKIGPTGAEIPLAEDQVKNGRVTPVAVAVAGALGGEGALTAKAWEKADRQLVLTDVANDQLNALDMADRRVVIAAFDKLGRPGDIVLRKAGPPGQYTRRQLGNGITLVYRRLDKISQDQPYEYVIMAIETEDKQPQRPDDR